MRQDTPYKQRGDDYILYTIEFESEEWEDLSDSEQEDLILRTAEESILYETNEDYIAFQIKRTDVRSDSEDGYSDGED